MNETCFFSQVLSLIFLLKEVEPLFPSLFLLPLFVRKGGPFPSLGEVLSLFLSKKNPSLFFPPQVRDICRPPCKEGALLRGGEDSLFPLAVSQKRRNRFFFFFPEPLGW